MITNAYLPHVGGVARSVDRFSKEFRRRGHRVLVVAPEFNNMENDDPNVVRVPAIKNFNESGFSVRLPIPGLLSRRLEEFQPDIVHSHHPFLLGDTAMRVATLRNLPLVFTHHTMYEQYTHYVPGDSNWMKQFAKDMATTYANLCDCVIAPSESVAQILRQRGVETRIERIPTGIDLNRFDRGDSAQGRHRWSVRNDQFVIGHVGRLSKEKNLEFLANAVAQYVQNDPRALFLVVGEGHTKEKIASIFHRQGLANQLRLTSALKEEQLINAYHAMNVFVFSSLSETQGMVVAESMAAHLPVIALDAPGVREIVEDKVNGRLLSTHNETAFCQALHWIANRTPEEYQQLCQKARHRAEHFSATECADRVLNIYPSVAAKRNQARHEEENPWNKTIRLLETEWNLWRKRGEMATDALLDRILNA